MDFDACFDVLRLFHDEENYADFVKFDLPMPSNHQVMIDLKKVKMRVKIGVALANELEYEKAYSVFKNTSVREQSLLTLYIAKNVDLNDVLEGIEGRMSDGLISEGDYLKCMNNMKNLYEDMKTLKSM